MRGEKSRLKSKRHEVGDVEGDIKVYGTSWCGMTQIVRRYFDKLNIPYSFYDLEDDHAAEKQLRWITGGYARHPTVVIEGQVLIQPEVDELQAVLKETGYLV